MADGGETVPRMKLKERKMNTDERSDIEKFNDALEEFRTALLNVVEPVCRPILLWLAKNLDRWGPAKRERDIWHARSERSHAVLGFIVPIIEERDGSLEGIKWHVTFDGNEVCIIPTRSRAGPGELIRILPLWVVRSTPWGDVGYGYDRERLTGAVFVAAEHAVDHEVGTMT